MRTEFHNGRWILCGHMLKPEQIKPGQTWQSSSNNLVRVIAVNGEWVKYEWPERDERRQWGKDAFSFQCRYCLVLPSAEIPKEYT